MVLNEGFNLNGNVNFSNIKTSIEEASEEIIATIEHLTTAYQEKDTVISSVDNIINTFK